MLKTSNPLVSSPLCNHDNIVHKLFKLSLQFSLFSSEGVPQEASKCSLETTILFQYDGVWQRLGHRAQGYFQEVLELQQGIHIRENLMLVEGGLHKWWM
jgi:hypothetical protein